MKVTKVHTSDIATSASYRKMTVRAIFSIGIFIITYFILILLAIGMTVLFGYIGLKIIFAKPTYITVIIGIGLTSIGLLIMIFLLKFIFKEHIVDRSHLIEITREEEPQLFKFINEIVMEVRTTFPKKIYLSADVNAAVFYDSSFWSMFLPTKKNLQIGLGLVNSTSLTEFKAILAHEFGHFSQRTMKVGSYVYNMNQIIYNVLYDNESFDELVRRWANINNYLAVFVMISVKIVHVIQWILKKIYHYINLSYLSLSREMEFNADEIAANSVGSEPLVTSLLRLDLADHSYQTILKYYDNKIPESVKTKNIYPQQRYVMNFIAAENNLKIENNLPLVKMEHLSRYNKSKLIIKDQWASHPSIEDRIRKLKIMNIQKGAENHNNALNLFHNYEEKEIKLTEKLFSVVAYSAPASDIENEQFEEEYARNYKLNTFSRLFNGYYDDKDLGEFDTATITVTKEDQINNINELFDNKNIDLIYSAISLTNDIDTLSQIGAGNIKIQSYEYDGHKYTAKDTDSLTSKLRSGLMEIKAKIATNDINIYKHFSIIAARIGKSDDLKIRYRSFFTLNNDTNDYLSVYMKMIHESRFIHQTTPVEIIESKMFSLKNIEKDFKNKIGNILKEKIYQSLLTKELREAFDKYLSRNWKYFYSGEYDNSALNVMITALNSYHFIVRESYFNSKKKTLEYMELLEKENDKLSATVSK